MGQHLHREELGEAFNEGARQLWLAMSRERLAPVDVTKRVGAKPGMVSRWLYGDVRASGKWRGACRAAFGIDPDLWDKPAVRAFVPPGARAA